MKDDEILEHIAYFNARRCEARRANAKYVEELEAYLLDDGMTLRKIRAFVQKNKSWGMSAEDALNGIKQVLEKDNA